MGKLRTPEEIKASKLEETAKYLAHAEDVLSELVGQLFGPENERINGTDDLNAVRGMGMELRSLVMALRRYPCFDVACLSSMKRFTFVYRAGTEDRKVEVMVPTFGVKELLSGPDLRFDLKSEKNEFYVGRSTRILFDHDLQFKNSTLLREIVNRFGAGNSWSFGELTARMPQIPVDVNRKIEEARPCFSQMTMVWEAEWSNAPVVDPLIIGSVRDQHFLVDKYDVTKLERYVSSEMTRPPLK